VILKRFKNFNILESRFFELLRKIFKPYIINIVCATETLHLAYLVFSDIRSEIIFINSLNYIMPNHVVEKYFNGFNWELFLWLIIHVMVALLFLIRKPSKDFSKKLLAHIVAISSMMYYNLYDCHVDCSLINEIIANYIIILGCILAVFSTLSLGRSFGVLPSYREIKTRYMYKIVRHPLYLSYIVMDLGIILGYTSIYNILVFILAITLFIIRIYYEENLLIKYNEYITYKSKINYKLIPFIY